MPIQRMYVTSFSIICMMLCYSMPYHHPSVLTTSHVMMYSPRYKLLLEELLRRTSSDDNERPGLEAALAKVMEVAKHINEGVRARETLEKVIELQNMFDPDAETKLELVAPNRFFIRRSTEKILRSLSEAAPEEDTEIILLSDLLVTSIISSPLMHMRMHEYEMMV
jgi:hypothetical protein